MPQPRRADLPGLYVVGLPWLYTSGSGRFSGIARDSEYLAELGSGDVANPIVRSSDSSGPDPHELADSRTLEPAPHQ